MLAEIFCRKGGPPPKTPGPQIEDNRQVQTQRDKHNPRPKVDGTIPPKTTPKP